MNDEIRSNGTTSTNCLEEYIHQSRDEMDRIIGAVARDRNDPTKKSGRS